MRRNYMSPEFNKVKVYGSFNMVEESNFFASKMLDIENSIYLQKQDIIYYQNLSGEQIDFSVESTLASNVYSAINNKRDYHTLKIDETQTSTQKNKNTKWNLEINLRQILSDYIFASMKRYRSFEGLTSKMTRYESVNVAIQRYVEFNVLDRYKLGEVELFISYKNLRSQSLLRFKNDWNPNVESDTNKFTKLQTETAMDGSSIKVSFNQEEDSQQFSFDYFFNLYFEKI
jgi:hypothetical protein